MATIVQNIQKVQTAMTKQAVKEPLGILLKQAAIAAIKAGAGTDERKTYMAMFADNDAQLDRLTKKVDTEDEKWLSEVQAYLISNSVCFPDTGTQTGNGILDSDLKNSVDNGMAAGAANVNVKKFRPAKFTQLVP